MLCTEFSSKKHQVLEHDLIRYCRENCPDESLRANLFLYFHQYEGTFVIAAWCDNDHHRFCDLYNMGFSLKNFDRVAAMDFFKKIAEPNILDNLKKEIYEAEKQAIRNAEEQQAQHQELEAKAREATGWERPDPILRG